MIRRLPAISVCAPLLVAAAATLLAWFGAPRPTAGTAGARLVEGRSTELTLTWCVAAILAAYGWRRARTAADVSDANRAMAESLRGLDEMRYALDQAAIVATTDHRGIITYANDKFCEISKYSRDELIGQDHRIINSDYHPKAFMGQLWRTIANGQVWRGEIRNRARDGSLYWVDTTIVPFLDGRGKPRQYLAIRSDITARKHAEAQIWQQAALTNLGQLAAVVAHEVRNPLAGLRATLQVFDGRFSDPRDHEVVAAMIHRIDGLNNKVEDLLLYARSKPARFEAVDVHALLHEAAASARVATGSVGPPIAVHGSPVQALADPDMLRATLLNLLINGCQAAGTGEVEVEVAGDKGVCEVAVHDRGPGIAPDVRDRVFDPFFSTRAGGTGLGLAIVKRLLELQDGEIELHNRRGGGTTATVTLPLAPRRAVTALP